MKHTHTHRLCINYSYYMGVCTKGVCVCVYNSNMFRSEYTVFFIFDNYLYFKYEYKERQILFATFKTNFHQLMYTEHTKNMGTTNTHSHTSHHIKHVMYRNVCAKLHIPCQPMLAHTTCLLLIFFQFYGN